MPDAADIEALVTRFVREELLHRPDAAVDPDDNLFTSGLVDSVGIMRLIAHVEESLGRKIPPVDLVPKNFRTIRVMAGYLSGEAEP